MAITFPNAPSAGTKHFDGGQIWRYDGVAWVVATFERAAEVLADTTPAITAGTLIRTTVDGYVYEVAAAAAVDHHLVTAGGVKLYARPDRGGWLTAEQFGVVPSDRDAAAANGARLQALVDAAAATTGKVDLQFGVIFSSVGIVQSGLVHVKGAGVNYWQKTPTDNHPGAAPTQIVMTGTGARTHKIAGVSSNRAWGAARKNESARAGYNDETYELTSFVVENAAATGRQLRGFSVAWQVLPTARGSVLESFRILPDWGGAAGMDGQQKSLTDATEPLSAGDWDVGIMLWAAREIQMRHVQPVGQWRIGGLFVCIHHPTEPAGCYNTLISDCTIARVLIRALDMAPVVAATATTVDIPWSDDHPFGADGDTTVLLSAAGRHGNPYTFTGMTKVTGGAYPILRLTGVAKTNPAHADVSTVTGALANGTGGGSSHLVFERGEITGFGHNSRYPAEKADLGGGTPFGHPLAMVEISGDELTEISFRDTSITGYETVAIHVHDCRQLLFDNFVEINARSGETPGARVIASPSRSENPWVADGAPGGANEGAGTVAARTETLRLIWQPRGDMRDGSVDLRPWFSNISTPALFADGDDPGLFTPAYLLAPREALGVALDEGSLLLAAPNSRAGIGRRTGEEPFFGPDQADADLALYYSEAEDLLRLRKTLRSNTAGQADLGDPAGGEFGGVWAQRFASDERTALADDSFAVLTPGCTGGWALLTVSNSDGTLPLATNSALLFFDVGATLAMIKLPSGVAGLGDDVEVATGALTGTTGTDGVVTVSAVTGAVHVENRTGATRQFRIAFIG